MPSPRCGECNAFFRREGIPEENPDTHQIEFKPNPEGICRLHPPTLHMTPQGTISTFPGVRDDWRCEDYRPVVVEFNMLIEPEGLAQLS
jgi:hypothetical protein